MHLQHQALHQAAKHAVLDARQHHGDGGGPATIVPIVFITAKQTFEGPVEGFSTNFGSAAVQTVAAPSPSRVVVTHTAESQPEPTHVEPSEQHPTTHPVVATHVSSEGPHETAHASLQTTPLAGQPTTSAVAAETSVSPSFADGALASASASAAPTAVPTSSDQGMSTGAKAGIAIGVILGLAALGALVFALVRLMKKRQEEREDEKHNPFGDSAAAPPPPKATRGYTPPPVPPMSDFPRPSTAATNGPFAEGAPSMMSTGAPSMVTHPLPAPSAGAPSMRSVPPPEPPINPFGEHAQIGSQTSFNGSIPIGDDTQPSLMAEHSETDMIGAAMGGAAIGAAAGGLAASTSRHEPPKHLELEGSRPMPPFAAGAVPASPSPSQYSFASAAPAVAGVATGAAAGAAGAAASTVYRVQLDFHPSMGDEMDLRSGELVRMVHEYDDGWALCVKFDKSARGVCPRTCLSQKPLQPRAKNGAPRPGPSGPDPRGPPPSSGRASPAPSNRGPPGGPMRTASPAPSVGPTARGPAAPPSRTASPAPVPGAFPTSSRSASPAPGPGGPGPALNPNLGNWPARPINASTITPNLSNWPAQPVNFKRAPAPRSMSPGPYGGGPSYGGARPTGPVKRRSQSVGHIPSPGPGTPPGPVPSQASMRTATTTSGEFQLPIMGAQRAATPTGGVSRKPVPGQW